MNIIRWCICEVGLDGRPAVAQYAREWRQTYDVSVVGGPVLMKIEATFALEKFKAAQADPKIIMFPSRNTPARRMSQRLKNFLSDAKVVTDPTDRVSDVLRQVRNRFGHRFTRDISDLE